MKIHWQYAQTGAYKDLSNQKIAVLMAICDMEVREALYKAPVDLEEAREQLAAARYRAATEIRATVSAQIKPSLPEKTPYQPKAGPEFVWRICLFVPLRQIKLVYVITGINS